MIAFATTPIIHFQLGNLVTAPQGGDFYSVQLSDTEVLSVQPDGTYSMRPTGTFGVYEVCQKVGNNLVYRPTASAVFVIPLIDGLGE